MHGCVVGEWLELERRSSRSALLGGDGSIDSFEWTERAFQFCFGKRVPRFLVEKRAGSTVQTHE